MVLALLAMGAMIAVTNFDAISRSFNRKPVEALLKKAVYEARYQAAYTRRPVFLDFNSETKAFQIKNEKGVDLSEAIETHSEMLEVTFFPIRPETRIESPPEYAFANNPLGRIAFHPDRSATPFVVRLDLGSTSLSLRVDPFSNAAVPHP